MSSNRRLSATACALLAAFSFTVHSLELRPDQVAAEEAAHQFLDALSAGPEQNLNALADSFFATEMRQRLGDERAQELLSMLSRDFSGLNAADAIREVTLNGEHWDVLVVNDFDQRYLLGITLIGATSPKLNGLTMEALPLDVPTVNAKDIAGTADKYIADRVRKNNFSGTVLLAKHDKIIYSQAVGMADIQAKRPNTLDTPLNIGSMNKMFTGILIGRLVADGTLNWDDNVGQHLPGLPNKRIRDEVTIHQLLTHTSGVGSYWNQSYEDAKHELDSLDGLLATFIDEPLLFEPGQGNEYSNGGPVILGLIVEKYMKMSYYDAARQFIYKPAGMSHSDHYRTDDRSAGLAIGYYPGPDGLSSNSEQLGLMGSPAGGGYASANDMLSFSAAISSGALLEAKTLAQIWTPYAELGPDFGYGYLWGIGTLNGHRWVGHNGGSPGVSADYRYYPESGYTVIVLSNRDYIARPVSDWLNELVTLSTD